MGGKDIEERRSIKVTDNVIMGDLNINTETGKMIEIKLPVNEKVLIDFILSNWMNIINKYGSENINLDHHRVVIANSMKQLKNNCLIGESPNPFLLFTEQYFQAIIIDPRILSSSQMQLELEILRAIISWKENDFDSFQNILINVMKRIPKDAVYTETGLGIFELLYTDRDFFLQSDEIRPESLDTEEVVCMLAVDAICEFCFDSKFIQTHCRRLLGILAKNHEIEQGKNGLFLQGYHERIWKNVKLELIHAWGDGIRIWEPILKDNTFSYPEFEMFLRMLLSERETLFDANRINDDLRPERFAFVKYSIGSIHSKTNELSKRINLLDKNDNLNQILIEEIFDWFELLAFISTLDGWLDYDKEYSYRWVGQNEWSIYWYLEKFLIHFDSILEGLDERTVQSIVEKQKELPLRIFAAINAINARYAFTILPIDPAEQQLVLQSLNNLFNFHEADFGTSWNMATYRSQNFSLEADHMPRWWPGSPLIRAHPDYWNTYHWWLDEKSIRKIRPPYIHLRP